MRSSVPICDKRDWLGLKQPKSDSHKGQNGRLLIFAGSSIYHGSLILAIKTAVRFCDLVYVYTHESNEALILWLKEQSANIIVLTPRTISQFFSSIDAFLVGPGWEQNEQNCLILQKILKTKKPVVIDATALRLLNLSTLHKNVLLTPHTNEFESLFSLSANQQNAKLMAKKYKCTILLKGSTDIICSASHIKLNNTGNVGMTKGGTGDVLAGLCASVLSCSNSPYKSACACAYLNGYTAQLLEKKMGTNFSSEDLANELAIASNSLKLKN
jgi:NAD(P)H-hydrate epimerase